MLSFHPLKRSKSEGNRPQDEPVALLAVEAYTGHRPDDYYADLGFRSPAR